MKLRAVLSLSRKSAINGERGKYQCNSDDTRRLTQGKAFFLNEGMHWARGRMPLSPTKLLEILLVSASLSRPKTGFGLLRFRWGARILPWIIKPLKPEMKGCFVPKFWHPNTTYDDMSTSCFENYKATCNVLNSVFWNLQSSGWKGFPTDLKAVQASFLTPHHAFKIPW